MASPISSQLSSLLSPPSPLTSREHSLSLLPHSIPSSQLPSILSTLLKTSSSRLQHLEPLLASSQTQLEGTLNATRTTLDGLRRRTEKLKEGHEGTVERLIDTREELVTSLGEKEKGGQTLREKLIELARKREGLESAARGFEVLVKAESIAIDALKALIEQSDRDASFEYYVALVSYSYEIKERLPGTAISTQVIAMASSVFNSLSNHLQSTLEAKLEKIKWPTEPLKMPVEWNTNLQFWETKLAIVDLVLLEQLNAQHPLPSLTSAGMNGKVKGKEVAKPHLAIIPFVKPLLLRFKWQFDSDRTTNRIDKPEYPLSHILNVLSTHERFMDEEVKDVFAELGASDISPINELTTLLLPLLKNRLRHHLPQLLQLPPILAHTIYQTLEFDQVVRGRGYRVRLEDGSEGEWEGLSEVILGREEWRKEWERGEKEFFDNKYYAIISSNDAWVILGKEDFENDEMVGGVRPTNSALRVSELSELLSDRYRPLPIVHQPAFLLNLHLPLLKSYLNRITSSLDAFESLSFGLALPGALGGVGGDRGATAGVGGVVRLIRAGVSAKWMEEKCREWGEEPFFVGLAEYLRSHWRQLSTADGLREKASEVVDRDGERSLFEGLKEEFGRLSMRAEELVVRHVVKEVMGELKTYLGRRWDYASESEGEEDPELSLTSDLISPLSLFTSLLSSLVQSLPSATSTSLYRRIASQLSSSLFSQLLVNRSWTELGAKQFKYDFEYGFLQAGRESGIKRGVGRGWELLKGSSIILALPAGSGTEDGEVTFAGVMRSAFDDSAGDEEGTELRDLLEELGVPETVGKKQIRQVMRRRPECWR